MKERPEPDELFEQFLVSGSVIRQKDKLPPEVVEQHLQILAGLGVVGQALHLLTKMPGNTWLEIIDKLQRNK